MKLLLLCGFVLLMLFFSSPSFFPPSNAAAIPPSNRTSTSFASSPSTTSTKTTALVPGECPCGMVRVVFDDQMVIIGIDRRVCKDKTGSNLGGQSQLQSPKLCYYAISFNHCGGAGFCGSNAGYFLQQDFNNLHGKFVAQSQSHSHELYVDATHAKVKTACKVRSQQCKTLFTRGIVDFVNDTWSDGHGNPFSFSVEQKATFVKFVDHCSKMHNAYGVVLPRSVKQEIHFSQEVLQLEQDDPITDPQTTTVPASTSTVPSPTPAEMSSCPACPVCQVCPSGTPAVASPAQPGLGGQGGDGGNSEKGQETSSSRGIDYWLFAVGFIISLGVNIGLAVFIFKKRGFYLPKAVKEHISLEKRQQKQLKAFRNTIDDLTRDKLVLLDKIAELREAADNEGNKKKSAPKKDRNQVDRNIRNKKGQEFRAKCLKQFKNKEEQDKLSNILDGVDYDMEGKDAEITNLTAKLKEAQLTIDLQKLELDALKAGMGDDNDNDNDTTGTTNSFIGTATTGANYDPSGATSSTNTTGVATTPATSAVGTSATSTAPP